MKDYVNINSFNEKIFDQCASCLTEVHISRLNIIKGICDKCDKPKLKLTKKLENELLNLYQKRNDEDV